LVIASYMAKITSSLVLTFHFVLAKTLKSIQWEPILHGSATPDDVASRAAAAMQHGESQAAVAGHVAGDLLRFEWDLVSLI
jgi:hypothetical protein